MASSRPGLLHGVDGALLVGDDAAGRTAVTTAATTAAYTPRASLSLRNCRERTMVEDRGSCRRRDGGVTAAAFWWYQGAATSQGGDRPRSAAHSSFGPGSMSLRRAAAHLQQLPLLGVHHLSVTRTQTDGSNVSHMEQHYGSAPRLPESWRRRTRSAAPASASAPPCHGGPPALRTSPQQAALVWEEGVDSSNETSRDLRPTPSRAL